MNEIKESKSSSSEALLLLVSICFLFIFFRVSLFHFDSLVKGLGGFFAWLVPGAILVLSAVFVNLAKMARLSQEDQL